MIQIKISFYHLGYLVLATFALLLSYIVCHKFPKLSIAGVLARGKFIRMIHNMWNGEVKVITGIRRCGKSVLLFDLFYEHLLSQGVQEDHILKIQLDQRRYNKFRNPITLCEYVEALVAEKKDEKFYLFIDEDKLTLVAACMGVKLLKAQREHMDLGSMATELGGNIL